MADACFAREATEDAGRRCGAACSDGEGRNRTGDTTIFSRVLYQLSYLAKLAHASGGEIAPAASLRGMEQLSYVRAFVEEVLRTGIALGDLIGDLIDALPDDAYPGENKADVLLDMVAGSVQPVLAAAGEETVEDAMALVGALYDKTMMDLKLAVEIARERE